VETRGGRWEPKNGYGTSFASKTPHPRHSSFVHQITFSEKTQNSFADETYTTNQNYNLPSFFIESLGQISQKSNQELEQVFNQNSVHNKNSRRNII
jgi:hypothetical protein